MSCLKCGKDNPSGQVFCDGCRQVMQQYPVKPGTPVFLPKRTSPTPEKKAPRHKQITAEQQLAQLRRINRWLFAAATTLLLLVCLLTFLLFK